MHFEGWRLTGVISAGLAVFLATTQIGYGLNEDGVRVWVRNSARSSVILFSLAFAASSLQRLLRRRWSDWLLRNRRYKGCRCTPGRSKKGGIQGFPPPRKCFIRRLTVR